MAVRIFLDESKAFDKVWHEGLLHFPNWALLYIDSYLNNGTFKVNWNGNLSNDKIIGAGVTQGSVLGPSLFNLYMTDFPIDDNWMTNRALHADDVCLLARSKNWKLAKECAQESLDLATKW